MFQNLPTAIHNEESKMKKMILVLLGLVVLGVVPAMSSAASWCQWDGSAGVNCVAERNGALRIKYDKDRNLLPNRLWVGGSVANKNSWGYFQLTQIVLPYDPNTQREDVTSPNWDKTGDQITMSFPILELTVDEVNGVKSQALSSEMYLVLKWMNAQGYISATTAPQWLKDAYDARTALGQ